MPFCSSFAAIQTKPDCRAISTDTYVPISRLADCRLDSVAEVDATGLPRLRVGHVGDSNVHFGDLIDPDIPRERKIAKELNHKLVARAAAGAAPAQDGVPAQRRRQRHGRHDRTIMRALDPKNILNPGEIFVL